MKKKLESQISINPTPNDLTVIREIALVERRKPSDVIRNLFEDVMDGKTSIEPSQAMTGKRHAMGVMVDPTFKSRFDQFKEEKHLSADKILHLALQNFSQKAIAGEATSDDITENMIHQKIHESRIKAPYTPEEREAAIAALRHNIKEAHHGNPE